MGSKSWSLSLQASVLLPTWKMMEFEGRPVSVFVAPGLKVSLLGSSGTLLKKLSNNCLNSSRLVVFRFITLFGRQFHTLGPAIWKLCSRSFWTFELPLRFGILHIRPFLSVASVHPDDFVPLKPSLLWIHLHCFKPLPVVFSTAGALVVVTV